MSKKTIVILVLLIVSPVVIWLLWPTDEAQIRKLIRQTAEAAETADVEGVMKGVSFNYSDSYGMSYALLKNNIERVLRPLSGIEVVYTAPDIEVFEDETAQASMELEVLATMDGNRGYFLGGPGNKLTLTIKLAKNQLGQWRVTHAEYDVGSKAPFDL